MPSILFRTDNGVGHITLNRPEKLNSFNREMALLFQQTLDECAADANIRAVLITGAGKGFCAGQDLAEVVDADGPGMDKILSEHYNPIIEQLRGIPKPVIAAVNGVAAGAGANLAFACDIVLSAQSASFIQAFSKIGLVPDSGGTYHLPRLVGMQRALALMMLGDKVSAQDAMQMGMVYRVFADDALASESDKLAQTMAAMPTKALGYIKQLLNDSYGNSLTEQLKLEDEYQQKAAATNDFKEGVQAFLEKRIAHFKGE